MRYLSLALILALASCGESQPEQAEPTPAQVDPEPALITHECVELGGGNRPVSYTHLKLPTTPYV